MYDKKIIDKHLRIGIWCNLGLKHKIFTGNIWQNLPKLTFAGTVTSCSLDMVYTQLEGTVNRGFEVLLAIIGNLVHGHIIPFVLVTHAAA